MLYKISCQRENKAQYCGWNTSGALYTMRSYLKDWQAGPGATTDIKADKIISMKWLVVIVLRFKYRCGWHRLRRGSSRIPVFVFPRPPLSPSGANHQADRPGDGREGGHQFQRGDGRQGGELHQRLRQGETRHNSRMALKHELCTKNTRTTWTSNKKSALTWM